MRVALLRGAPSAAAKGTPPTVGVVGAADDIAAPSAVASWPSAFPSQGKRGPSDERNETNRADGDATASLPCTAMRRRARLMLLALSNRKHHHASIPGRIFRRLAGPAGLLRPEVPSRTAEGAAAPCRWCHATQSSRPLRKAGAPRRSLEGDCVNMGYTARRPKHPPVVSILPAENGEHHNKPFSKTDAVCFVATLCSSREDGVSVPMLPTFEEKEGDVG